MRIKAVIFDLFGTLTRQFPLDGFEQSLEMMSQAIGLEYQSFFDAWTGQTSARRQTGTFSDFREEITWICRQKGITPSEESLDEAIKIRYDFTMSVLQPRPDAVVTIRNLSSLGLLTGLISDCSKEVPELWPETPFYDLFDTTIFSCEAGVKKPDPAIFRMACNRLGVTADRCVYIGDGFSRELSGARSYGMEPFLLLPPDEKPPTKSTWEGRTWDGEKIASLNSIIDIIKKRNN